MRPCTSRYTQTQFTEVCVRLLEREQVDVELGAYIADQVWGTLRNRDIREAVRIAQLAKTQGDVDSLVNILNKYRSKWRQL